MVDAKSLRIRFDKIDAFIRVYDGTRCLVLFGKEKCNFVYNRIGCLNYAMTFLNVIILIKSVFNKDKNNYYYNIFLGKSSYEFLYKI